MRIRKYQELKSISSFEDRYDYLRLKGQVGLPTFGFERYLNQKFYTSREWRDIRHHVISRDLGCDLGVEGFDIHDKVIIHHMNPMRIEDISDGNYDILDPEYLITTTHKTHMAIHYGNTDLLPKLPVDRRPGDTQLWPKQSRY